MPVNERQTEKRASNIYEYAPANSFESCNRADNAEKNVRGKHLYRFKWPKVSGDLSRSARRIRIRTAVRAACRKPFIDSLLFFFRFERTLRRRYRPNDTWTRREGERESRGTLFAYCLNICQTTFNSKIGAVYFNRYRVNF